MDNGAWALAGIWRGDDGSRQYQWQCHPSLPQTDAAIRAFIHFRIVREMNGSGRRRVDAVQIINSKCGEFRIDITHVECISCGYILIWATRFSIGRHITVWI